MLLSRFTLTLWLFGEFCGICFAQWAEQKERKNWPTAVEIFANYKFNRPIIDYPSDLFFTPAYRAGQGQVAAVVPPFGSNWAGDMSLGLNVRPFPRFFLNNVVAGFDENFSILDNGFRGGKLWNRAQFANGEDAFTYTRVSKYGPFPDFRVGYSIPLSRDENGEALIEIGGKYTLLHGIEVTQGYDTFDRDEVYRKTLGNGRARGGYACFKIGIPKEFRVRFGIEYEKGSVQFQGFAGKRSFSQLTIGIIGVERSF